MTATASAARRREDLTAWFIFATLIAMSAALGAALLVEEKPYEDRAEGEVRQRNYQGHGVTHPEFAVTRSATGEAQPPSMLHGGSGRERHQGIIVPAGMFAVLTVIFGMTCMYLGTLKPDGPSPLKKPFIAVALIGCVVMIATFYTYWRFLNGGKPGYFLGFPTPTAWMIYGVYLFPILAVLCFICWFDGWYAPPQINEELQRIMSQGRDGKAEQH